jgi:hypothetical protein
MNAFQLDFYPRLRAWHELRNNLTDALLHEQCIEVDKFWQQSPMSNHYLHPADIKSWPDPWQLINDNIYCSYSRALGMIYTLLLLGVTDIDLVDCIDYNNENVVLVLVDNARYAMNYWPNTVVNNKIQNFTIVRKYDLTPIIQRVGKL